MPTHLPRKATHPRAYLHFSTPYLCAEFVPLRQVEVHPIVLPLRISYEGLTGVGLAGERGHWAPTKAILTHHLLSTLILAALTSTKKLLCLQLSTISVNKRRREYAPTTCKSSFAFHNSKFLQPISLYFALYFNQQNNFHYQTLVFHWLNLSAVNERTFFSIKTKFGK
jgi:hypothetical protein